MKVLITSMRNEADYIVEWISWHQMIGFDKFLIYTNNNNDNTISILEKLKKIGVVEFFELSPPKGKQPQMYAFNEGVKWLHKNKPKWISCLDADEFLVLKKDSCLDDYLDRFEPDIDAIAINWRIFGSGGIKYKGMGLTPERFLCAAPAPYKEHRQFKSLFKYNPDLVRFHHRAIYRKTITKNINYIYSDGVALSEADKEPYFPLDRTYITYDYAQVNHYTIRSHEEFLSKMSRGNGLDPALIENERHKEYLNKFDKASVYDNSALNFLERYIASYNLLSSKLN
ncbi:glycosyltransferase family 2 protein [Pseudoalteromonas sp. B28]